MEQETSARIAQLSAQLGQAAEDSEHAAAASAAEHARKIAELEDRGFKAMHQVGNQPRNEAALGYATDCSRRSNHVQVIESPTQVEPCWCYNGRYWMVKDL